MPVFKITYNSKTAEFIIGIMGEEFRDRVLWFSGISEAEQKGDFKTIKDEKLKREGGEIFDNPIMELFADEIKLEEYIAILRKLLKYPGSTNAVITVCVNHIAQLYESDEFMKDNPV
ncbi:MAG: hypothetical protein WCF94_00520 [bacterium]